MRIKLENAFLCLDCETVSDNSRACTFCGSVAVHSLARFINRAYEDNSLLLARALQHTCQDVPVVPCVACNMSNDVQY